MIEAWNPRSRWRVPGEARARAITAFRKSLKRESARRVKANDCTDSKTGSTRQAPPGGARLPPSPAPGCTLHSSLSTLHSVVVCLLLAQGFVARADDDFLTTCVQEIAASIETIKYVNPSETRVFYTFRGETGAYELRYIDLATGAEHVVPLEHPIDEIDRWSPNGRWLLIQCVGPFKTYPGHGFTRPAWLLVLDSTDLSVKRLGSGYDVFEENPVWCRDDLLIFTSTDLNDKAAKPVRYWVKWKHGNAQPTMTVPKWRPLAPLHDPDIRLMRLGQNRLAFSDRGLVFSLDLNERRIEQLSFVQEESIVPRWLNPCVSSGDILYCATRTTLPNRNLFLLKSPRSRLPADLVAAPGGARLPPSPDPADPIQLSEEHTYNGKWLEDGSGYAYIANTNNMFYLALRPKAPSERTNLFTLGHIDNFMPDAKGTRVFAVATPEGGEPCALWEYDIHTRRLRQLRSGSRIPLAHARAARIEKLEIPSFDGLVIQGYLFSTNTPEATRQAATVVYLPPRTYQMRRKFDLQPELIANCGFNIVGINYRGMDGFGTDFSRLYNPQQAARDVLTVTHRLIEEGKIAPKPLYLLSQSLGSEVMKEVLVQGPGLWAAAIFQNPVSWDGFGDFQPAQFPQLLLSVGREDPAFPFMRRFEDWARRNHVPVTTSYLSNYDHGRGDFDKYYAADEAVARFLIGIQ